MPLVKYDVARAGRGLLVVARQADAERTNLFHVGVVFHFHSDASFGKQLPQCLRGRVVHQCGGECPAALDGNFDSVTFMDSAGIGLIIGRYKLANIIGARVELKNLSSSVRKIFDMIQRASNVPCN